MSDVQVPNPDALVEGQRVTTARDMESTTPQIIDKTNRANPHE